MGTDNDGRIVCDACGKTYKWVAQYAGRKVKCKCGATMAMPAEDPSGELALDLPEDMMPAQAAPAPATRQAAASAGAGSCPSCDSPVNPGAVICVSCGYNLKEGKKLTTISGADGEPGGRATEPRRNVNPGARGGFMDRTSRGWTLAKISYGILWDFKQLIIFPVFSGSAALLVMASFFLPLWGSGTLDRWMQTLRAEPGPDKHLDPLMFVVLFLFYFVSYLVVIFFNTALTACAMEVTAGQQPTVGYGLKVASRRFPQIAAWACIAALVSLLLKVIEGTHKKAGQIIAAVLGGAWTIVTFMVVPVICVEGVGPITAFKRSFGVLKETWGEGLVGNASLGLFNFLLFLPIIIVFFGGMMLSGSAKSGPAFLLTLGLSAVLFIVYLAVTHAADGVFRALLYNYATGRELPADVDQEVFAQAFASKR